MKIYFFTKKTGRKGATLYVRVTIAEEVADISTGLKVNTVLWDQDSDVGEFVQNVRKRLLQTHNNLVKDNAFITAQRVKDAYLNKWVHVRTVVDELDHMIDRILTEVKIGNRSKALAQKHKVFRKYLKGYITQLGYPDIGFEQVTVEFMQGLETYIKDRGCNHNTTKKQIDIMRKLFRYAKANKWAEHDPFYFYKISERPVKKEPLTEDELRNLMQKEFFKRVASVRDVFIVQCFTGMSYSDVKRFDKSMTYQDQEGGLWIDSSRVKTGVDFDVPILPQVVDILKTYDFKLPVLSNQKMNSYLKEIADVCGIEKNLTTHLARRTFASILNEKGVNITAIQQMLGHTKITTTQHYITTNRKFLKEEMQKVADGFKHLFKKPPKG